MPLWYMTDLLKLLKVLRTEASSSFQIVCRVSNGPLEKIRKLANNSEMSKTYSCSLLSKWYYAAAPQFSSLQRKGSLFSSEEYFEADS